MKNLEPLKLCSETKHNFGQGAVGGDKCYCGETSFPMTDKEKFTDPKDAEIAILRENVATLKSIAEAMVLCLESEGHGPDGCDSIGRFNDWLANGSVQS